MTDTVQVPAPRGFSGATLHLDIDPVEHQRRQDAGIGIVTGHGFGGLDHLMALPAGLPVHLSDLTPSQQGYARKAPAGILTITDDQVTRHAIRPCRVTLATIRSRTATKTALDSASRFAPFCARTVIIRSTYRHMADTLIEFGWYGIGVTLEYADGTLETLVEPHPWRPMRHTPAGWWFAEQAYATYLTCAAERTTAP